MRNDFIKLCDNIDYIESKFKSYVHETGFCTPSEDYIFDNPEFIEWIEGIRYELQYMYEKTKDKYIWNLINVNGVINDFDGKHYDERESFIKLKSALRLLVRDINKYYPEENRGEEKMKKPMLFISHSSDDLLYVQPLVELFADIGLNNETMFCSSVPDYHIPMDNDIYDYLKGLFKNYEIHVIFALSKNYYKSAACLNEMGAAWVLQSKYSTILLPDFDFAEIKGAVNPSRISLKLENKSIDELKARLGELKDIISAEFGISVPANRWEKKRDTFIETIHKILQEGEWENVWF